MDCRPYRELARSPGCTSGTCLRCVWHLSILRMTSTKPVLDSTGSESVLPFFVIYSSVRNGRLHGGMALLMVCATHYPQSPCKISLDSTVLMDCNIFSGRASKRKPGGKRTTCASCLAGWLLLQLLCCLQSLSHKHVKSCPTPCVGRIKLLCSAHPFTNTSASPSFMCRRFH